MGKSMNRKGPGEAVKRNIRKRLLFHSLGILIMTFGIALTTKGGIGIAALSTITFAGSLLTPISFGMWSSLFHAFCFLSQIVLSRRFIPTSLFQIPMVYIFGWLLDFFTTLLVIPPPSFAVGCLFVAGGTLIFSFGLRIILGADIALTPPDALARAIGEKVGWAMPKAKLAFDITIVTISATLTLVFLGSAFIVVGAGTIISTLMTGPSIGLFTKLLSFFNFSD
jgi:uncharacterized membrane protein YczE